MSSVTINGLGKIFPTTRGEVPAVRELSLEIKEKELVVLAGPSGCGKTTTLRLIAGLEKATAGTVHIGGKDVTHVPAKDREVAMVFQNLALYPHMSARENIGFGLKARKLAKTEIASRIDHAIATLDLNQCVDRKPGEMSGGQRQRVALARALVLRPGVLLLDEPLSNLDAPLRARMRLEISRLHRALGLTMIYVTHDQIDAMSLGERLAVMNEGKLRQVAEPVAIYNRPADLFVAGFVGLPAMNLFRGELVTSGDTVLFREEMKVGVEESRLQLVLPATAVGRLRQAIGKRVIMGLRPEHISLDPVQKEASTHVTVEKVEHLGWEQHIHCRTAEHAFVMRRIDANTSSPCESRSAKAAFDLQAAHFFDASTGVRIA